MPINWNQNSNEKLSFSEPSIKFEAISADHWKQKLTFEINVTWTKEIYSEWLTKILNGGMLVSTLSIFFERSVNIKINHDTNTFKKWSNDPLSKNSVRIIMGQPKWQKGYYGSIPSPPPAQIKHMWSNQIHGQCFQLKSRNCVLCNQRLCNCRGDVA